MSGEDGKDVKDRETRETRETRSSVDRLRVPVLVAVVVLGCVIAMVPLIVSLRSSPAPAPVRQAPAGQGLGDQPGERNGAAGPGGPEDPEGTRYEVGDRQRADCPVPPADAPRPSPEAELADVELPCLTDGGASSGRPAAELLAGRPTVLNVWAWWCAPCRNELPVMEEVAQRHPEWNVVGVHVDGRGQNGLEMLRDLGVTFASFQDSRGSVVAEGNLPGVVPLTLVLAPDGTRAALHPGEFRSVGDVERAVSDALPDASSDGGAR